MRKIRTAMAICSMASLACGAAHADFCDHKPSKLLGKTGASVAGAVTGTVTATGAGMKAAGMYTLVHAGSGATMLGSTAAGASAAGTTGIIAGTGGAIGAVGSFLMAPVTLFVGAVTIGAGVIYEGGCYLVVEKVTDPVQVAFIVKSMAAGDDTLHIKKIDGDEYLLVGRLADDPEEYKLSNLYISDGVLMHRDWFLNTKIGAAVWASAK